MGGRSHTGVFIGHLHCLLRHKARVGLQHRYSDIWGVDSFNCWAESLPLTIVVPVHIKIDRCMLLLNIWMEFIDRLSC